MKAGVEQAGPVIREIPFSSERKRMTVLTTGETGLDAFAKGAPERILERCGSIAGEDCAIPLDDVRRQEVECAYEALAERGYRVLAVAERRAIDPGALDEEIEHDLTLLGLVGIIDPPRAEVKMAMEKAREAGIAVVMITGDAPVTALAIARMLGIPACGFVTGDELERMDDATLSTRLAQGVIFARTTPRHKMRIVDILQRQGRIVAMTGDGVNDAPALKKADIGIAMGIRGTDVAKDASDIVLLDDNFASIVAAVEEGRRQYANIRKFIRYLLSSNAGEVVAISANIVIGGPLVFLPIQILWMNLVTDGVTALTLGLEKSEPATMKGAPRDDDESVIGKRGLAVIMAFALYTGSATLFIFYQTLEHGALLAGTVAFTTMVFLEKFSVFAFRSLTMPVSRIGFFSNPYLLVALGCTLGLQVLAVYWSPLQRILHTTAIPIDVWGTIALLILPVVLVPEAYKILRASSLRSSM
jgi:Ca2+-transporting ATPase